MAQTSGKSFPPQALLIQPADPVAYYGDSRRAAALIEQKKWAEAEALLVQLTRAYPLDTALFARSSNWARLGLVLRQQGRCAEAIAAYRKVIELQGVASAYAGPSNARYSIAACQAKLGQTDAAIATLQQMLRDDHYVAKPDLFDDDSFAGLKADPRFRALVGHVEVAGLDRTAGWRSDIDYFISELKRSNPPGGTIPPEVYRRAQALKADVPRLNDQQVAIGLFRIMHPLDRGHTAVWTGAPGARPGLEFKPMPIRLYRFPEGMFITEGRGAAQDLVGAQVLKLGSATPDQAMDALGDAMSNESPAEVLGLVAALVLNRPGVLKGLGFVPDADRAELTLRLADGRVVTRAIAAGEEPPQTDWSRRLNPLSGTPTPLFLSHIQKNHWFEFLPEHDAVYVQVSNILPDEDETLPAFGLRLRKALAEHPANNLILDIRLNNGGDSFSYVELLRTVIGYSAQDGHAVYVIIGRDVYSAAANLSTDLERLAAPVFVGESTGGTGNQWGDESAFHLPWSGLTGAFSGARWQLSHPWDQRRSINPQVPVQLTAKAYFAGRDPVVETVFKLIDTRRTAP